MMAVTTLQMNILVVDDEAFFRKLYSDLLQEEDCKVEVCENGKAAATRLQAGGIDLLLTDMVMPEMDGLELLRFSRALPNPPEVVLITGHASLESAIEALKNGARDYLVKPFKTEEFTHLIRKCLEQRRLLAENVSLKQRIQLFQAGQSLSSLIDLDLLIEQAIDVLLRELGGTVGFGFSIKKSDKVTLQVTRNIEQRRAEQLLGMVLSETTVATGLCQPKLDLTGLVRADEMKTEQLWLLPLGGTGELRGGLLVCDATPARAQHSSYEDLHYLCEQIELGFENACRYENAQQLMYTDDLTGLYNHRYLQEAMAHEIRRSQRYGLQFSLLFLDLDKFKLINDTHGHLAGSAALKEVGSLLRDCVRDVDTLFRYGGDEFAALLVETDARTARIVAERIRRVLDEHTFLRQRKIPCRLTATVGYATFPTDALDKESLLSLADRAMYLGKQERNVIHGADESTEG